MRRILLVDDEPRVLEGLKKSLRVYRDRWTVVAANSAEAAIAELEQTTFEAVITDARMPRVGGAELLRHVVSRWPAMLRFVLSGQTDAQANDQLAFLAHQFFAKPTGSSELFERVEHACRLADLLAPPAVRAALCGLTVLPEFPWLVERLGQALDDPRTSLTALGRILAQGPGLAARALQLANSEFFGRGRAVVDIPEAAALLGKEGCRAVLASVVPLSADGRMLDELSRRVTSLARLSAAACSNCEAAYAAGLLAHLGTLVLAHGAGARYQEVWADHLGGAPLEDCEARRLGNTHCRVGATLLGLWRLPSPLVDAVGLQPAPPFGVPGESVTCAVKLAHAVDAEQQSELGTSAHVSALAGELALASKLEALRRLAREGIGAAA